MYKNVSESVVIKNDPLDSNFKIVQAMPKIKKHSVCEYYINKTI